MFLTSLGNTKKNLLSNKNWSRQYDFSMFYMCDIFRPICWSGGSYPFLSICCFMTVLIFIWNLIEDHSSTISSRYVLFFWKKLYSYLILLNVTKILQRFWLVICTILSANMKLTEIDSYSLRSMCWCVEASLSIFISDNCMYQKENECL